MKNKYRQLNLTYRIAAMIFSEFLDLGDLAGDLGSNDFLQILKRVLMTDYSIQKV
jgi:hypothetical protein